jgi:hypothetical protein
LRPVFGPGIRDVPVTAGTPWFVPLLAHTRYWRGPARAIAEEGLTALGALCDVLDLNSAAWLAQDRPPARDGSPGATET